LSYSRRHAPGEEDVDVAATPQPDASQSKGVSETRPAAAAYCSRALVALVLTVLPLPPWLDVLRPVFLVLAVLLLVGGTRRATGDMPWGSSPASRSMSFRDRCWGSTRCADARP